MHNTPENKCHYKTLDCWDSILKYTLSPYNIILIDNGSTDLKTKDWLASIEANKEKISLKYPYLNGIEILTNDGENTSAPVGFNIGIRYSMKHHLNNDYIAFLNNDMILNETCTNWIQRLINCMTKYVGIAGAPISSGRSFDRGRDADQWDVYFGCSILKKEVIDTIGYVDERFLIGMFEDNDYNLRMRRFGWQGVILRDLQPVHDHETSAIAFYDGKDNKVFKANRKRFNEKWKKWGYEK